MVSMTICIGILKSMIESLSETNLRQKNGRGSKGKLDEQDRYMSAVERVRNGICKVDKKTRCAVAPMARLRIRYRGLSTMARD